MRFRGERADGGTQIGKILDQSEAIELQTAGAAVLGLQEDRRRKLARQGGLAGALLTVKQEPRSQRCGNCANVFEAHSPSPRSVIASIAAPSGVAGLPSALRSSARRSVP